MFDPEQYRIVARQSDGKAIDVGFEWYSDGTPKLDAAHLPNIRDIARGSV